jgi:hypothetical protein
MTDARFPERWLNDRRLRMLSDRAFRVFVVALAWSAANRTDGVITHADLPLLPVAGPDAAGLGAGELADAGLWVWAGDHWQMAEFEETQTTSADLDHAAEMRRKARERKRRERARHDAAVPRDVTRDTTRTGQARPGQAPRAGPGFNGRAQVSREREEER